MIISELNGNSIHANYQKIKTIIEKYGCFIMDDVTKEPLQIIGICQNQIEQVGALLDETLYPLRSIYIDRQGIPHLGTNTIGGAILYNNIVSYNARTIYESRTIHKYELF